MAPRASWPTTWNEFADIDADRGDRGIGCLRHGVLLVFGAPCQLRRLAGQEHGRTVPLADMGFIARVSFSLYPTARQSANRTDIKITTTPVAKTSRSANKRRI
jgi:hypothetical protein